MPKKIIIFGLGETAHLAYEYFTHDSNDEIVAFCVDPEYIESDTFCGLPVILTDDIIDAYPPENFVAFAAAGSGKLNRTRASLFNKVKTLGYRMTSYVSSRAFIWHNVEIGENCMILEDNTLQPFTKVCDNVVLWSGNHIGHRTEIKDHCFITSHVVISGYCTIGENSFIGVNATFADHVKVARDNFISMGCVVTKNTENNGLYVGNPAEIRKVGAKRYCGVKN